MKKKKALQLISESFNDRSDARGDRARRFQRPGVSSVDFLDEGPSPFEQYRPNRSFVPRNVNPFPPLVAPRNANDVRLAIQDELDCWGIDSDHSRDHAVFSRLAVDESIMRFHGDKSHWTPPDTTAKVPRVLSDAIEFLLDFFLQKMTGGGKRLTFCNTRDFVEARFGVHLPYAPYFKKNGSLELSSAYRRIPRIHDYIDPFTRFHHVEEDPRAVVTSTWTKTSSEGAPYHIVEAVVIHQLIHGGHNCIRCKTFGSFELNSKYVTSFSDVICSVCGSVYAVWTASTTESILKRLSKGNCNKSRYFGDYYDEFRHLRRLSNMYAMFVSMEDTSYMPAYVVKINGVLPSLSGRSFNLENIKIFSKVLIQPVLGNHPWFSISMPEHLDFVSTSLVAIHKYFAGLVFHNGARAPNSQESDVHSNSSKSELRNLRRERNKIEVVKKKADNGDELAKEEVELLDREKEVLRMIQKFENLLRLMD